MGLCNGFSVDGCIFVKLYLNIVPLPFTHKCKVKGKGKVVLVL